MTNRRLTLHPDGRVELAVAYNPDPVLRLNAEGRKDTGWAPGRSLRRLASIDLNDVMKNLTVNTDPDMVAFMVGNDRAALHRLLRKHPEWKCSAESSRRGVIVK